MTGPEDPAQNHPPPERLVSHGAGNAGSPLPDPLTSSRDPPLRVRLPPAAAGKQRQPRASQIQTDPGPPAQRPTPLHLSALRLMLIWGQDAKPKTGPRSIGSGESLRSWHTRVMTNVGCEEGDVAAMCCVKTKVRGFLPDPKILSSHPGIQVFPPTLPPHPHALGSSCQRGLGRCVLSGGRALAPVLSALSATRC